MVTALFLGIVLLAAAIIVIVALSWHSVHEWIQMLRIAPKGIEDIKKTLVPGPVPVEQVHFDQIWDEESSAVPEKEEPPTVPTRTPAGRRFPTFVPLDQYVRELSQS